MSNRATTVTRRFCLSRVLLAAVAAPMAGLIVAEPARADKIKTHGTVAERTESQKQVCEIGGGKLAVLDGPNGGNTTECKGGTSDGHTCINTTTKTTCSTQQPDHADNPLTGGVDPSDLPDQPFEPADSDSPLDEPGGGWNQPLEPLDGGITLFAADHKKRRKAGRHGAHKRRAHGKGRSR